MNHPVEHVADPAAVAAAQLPMAGPEGGPMTPFELRMHLEAFGLTQAELAQLVGANVRTVRRWLEGPGDGPGIPSAVVNTLRAWQRLQHAGLPWRPEDALLDAGDVDAIAAHRYHALDLDAVLERVRARGGPAAPWDVDLVRQRATLGGVQLTFYLLANGGFAPQSYRRRDELPPDLARDAVLLEDGYACIARALQREGRRAQPALRLGPAGIVAGASLVMWEQRPFPTVVVIIPVEVARAVIGQSATALELREFADRNRERLAALAQALVDERAGVVNSLGARELRLDKALLERARPRRILLGEAGPFAGSGT